MGLDTSHDCWHGSYGSFALWRNAIAHAAGWHWERESRHGHSYDIPNEDEIPKDRYLGWWSGVEPKDPIEVLLIHSDCDGYIFPEHAEALADRLETLLYLDEDDEHALTEDWIRDCTQTFAEGLRRAYEEWEVVTFH